MSMHLRGINFSQWAESIQQYKNTTAASFFSLHNHRFPVNDCLYWMYPLSDVQLASSTELLQIIIHSADCRNFVSLND